MDLAKSKGFQGRDIGIIIVVVFFDFFFTITIKIFHIFSFTFL